MLSGIYLLYTRDPKALVTSRTENQRAYKTKQKTLNTADVLVFCNNVREVINDFLITPYIL